MSHRTRILEGKGMTRAMRRWGRIGAQDGDGTRGGAYFGDDRVVMPTAVASESGCQTVEVSRRRNLAEAARRLEHGHGRVTVTHSRQGAFRLFKTGTIPSKMPSAFPSQKKDEAAANTAWSLVITSWYNCIKLRRTSSLNLKSNTLANLRLAT